ncbi:Protein kinase domain-containing protein [Meloidogyne graminicola]|uniref:non-specific serine/threonine protein kinase n=1 Tax=Meloidogyne graminicola TaxID=189291 RepID=A0A8S9ZEN7_9BILA|nr:Protein kinase domain-containing protein [Meloidogyne graminicola]
MRRRSDLRNSMRNRRQPLDIKKMTRKPEVHGIMRTQDGRKLHPHIEMGFLLRARFRIHDVVGSGGFGQIFKASDKMTGHNFAVKICRSEEEGNRLIIEQRVMYKLNEKEHFPFMVASGTLDLPRRPKCHYIIMELLGPSLANLRKTLHSRRFSVGTTLRIGVQCVDAMEMMHRVGYLHRDIKPSNMCIGLAQFGKHRNVFIIDFGMARKYLQPNGQLRKERGRAAFRGTTRYVSLTVHDRKETGPVDDLWSLYYSIIEMGEGILPWRMRLRQKDVEEMKRKRFPSQFGEFEKSLKKLKWSDMPNYKQLRDIIQDCYPSEQSSEAPFEWERTTKNFT